MFDILIYLFETYAYSALSSFIKYDHVIQDLLDVGFQKKDIYNTLNWLQNLSYYKKILNSPIKISYQTISTRIYTSEESFKLNVDCRGFMLFLEELEILTLDVREIIIERIMALDINELDLEDLKWIVLIILFNIPGCETAYHKLESLLFNCTEKLIH